MIRPDRAQHLQLPRTVQCCHLSLEMPGKLDRKSTYTSPSTNDQDFLPRLDIRSSDMLQRFEPSHRERSSFLIANIGRFQRYHPLFREAFVLRISTQTNSCMRKNLVTNRIPLYIVPHSFDFS